MLFRFLRWAFGWILIPDYVQFHDLRLVSDGKNHTRLFCKQTGLEIGGITDISWNYSAGEPYPTVVVKLTGVDIEVDGQVIETYTAPPTPHTPTLPVSKSSNVLSFADFKRKNGPPEKTRA